MVNETPNTNDPLETHAAPLRRVARKLLSLLATPSSRFAPRRSRLRMCFVALEHGTALRALMALGLPTSALSLTRLQFRR